MADVLRQGERPHHVFSLPVVEEHGLRGGDLRQGLCCLGESDAVERAHTAVLHGVDSGVDFVEREEGGLGFDGCTFGIAKEGNAFHIRADEGIAPPGGGGVAGNEVPIV